jgi:hypothetical protein
MADLLTAFLEYERNYQGQVWIDWARDHAEIPVFTVCAYLSVVFYGPEMLESHNIKMELRGLVVLWNASLAVFSIIGVTRTVPHLASHIWHQGFGFTVCTDPEKWYLDGPVGLWVALFIFSKIPELIDTLFLVLRRRKVIFLHWFHHCTVMMFCWHAYHQRIATGLWFASMNFLVHSIMYTYYAAMAARMKWLISPFALVITTAQILQMAAGALVTVVSARRHAAGGFQSCAVDAANYKLGIGMYCSYLALFSMLFYSKYIKCRCCGKTTGRFQRQEGGRQELCGVDLKNGDATGRFNDGLGVSAPAAASIEMPFKNHIKHA